MRPVSPVDLSLLPVLPGVYKMLDRRGVVIYVGKAKNLRNRIRSYFQDFKRLDAKTRRLVPQIADISIIVVRSESEALILEAQLVKELQPRYNILLKDDKAFPYLKLTSEPFPRLLIVRERKTDNAHYFGPYPSIGSTKALQRMVHDVFKLRDCSQPIDMTTLQPKCIKLDLQQCLGPCIFKSVADDYRARVLQLKQVLAGKNSQVIKMMRLEMEHCSALKRFEQAAEWRDRIRQIERLGERQAVRIDSVGRVQLWVAVEEKSTLYVLMQTFIDGRLLYQGGTYLDQPDEFTRREMLEQSILGNYESCSEPVDSVLCDPWLAEIFEELKASGKINTAVEVKVPMRGVKLDAVETARQNARLAIARLLKARFDRPNASSVGLLEAVQATLALNKLPQRIIGFDSSHLQGTNIVASAVCFSQGKPNRSDYRKFKIQSVTTGDSNDPLSIYEAVSRRIQLGFSDLEPLPDLLLIDGGRGQINFAYRALQELGVEREIDLISLAKQNEEIFRVGDPNSLVLSRDDRVLKLLQQVRDEAHRFALIFQRARRKRDLEKSVLHQIPGIGPKRLGWLYKHFFSISELEKATDEEISRVGRISIATVHLIRAALKSNQSQ